MTIDPERWNRVKALAIEALERDPAEWPELLEARCGDDPELLEAARSLLDAQLAVAVTFLEKPPGPDSAVTTDAPQASPGAQVGPYRIVRKLGEGGMGEVWLAEQREPLRRQVALKLIKLGMDTRQVLVRFEAERQALARMSHPNVARVLDAGATERGRPYFTMEYVQGEPITDYCDRHRLTVAQRIELFIPVCEGIQHAHQKGIIHRDIKPSNILVTIEGEKALPKIIDFGVAKATQQRLTERSMFTQIGLMVGTPAYMSPEQAEMTSLDIDTRTDIYSLGAVLYELLVGALPFSEESLRAAGWNEIQRKIRDDDPPRPSIRVSSLGPASEESTRRRRATVASLRRELQGGLDWIVMMAMDKDRTRRYGTGIELANDLRRFLEHRPVQASPPNTAYRLRKFLRRNRAGVAAAAAVVLALLFGLAAEELRRKQAETARQEAVLQAEIANTVMDFVIGDLLGSVDPDKAQGREITVREVFDAAAAKFEGRFVEQPQVDAELSQAFGDVYVRLLRPDDAEPHLQHALELRRQLFGKESVEAAETLASLAMCGYVTGRDEYPRSIAYAEEALAIRERLLGPDAILTNRLRGLLAMYRAVAGGKVSSSLDNPMLVLALGSIRNRGETPEQVIAWGENVILEGERLWAGGQHDRGRAMLRQELVPFLANDIYAEQVPFALAGYAHRAYEEGLPNAAELSATVALEVGRERLGEGHRYTLFAAKVLASIREHRGDLAAAAELYEYFLPTVKRVLGPESREALGATTALAGIYTKQERYEEAEDLLREAWPVHERVSPPERRREAMSAFVALYDGWGKADRAGEWRARLAGSEADPGGSERSAPPAGSPR